MHGDGGRPDRHHFDLIYGPKVSLSSLGRNLVSGEVKNAGVPHKIENPIVFLSSHVQILY